MNKNFWMSVLFSLIIILILGCIIPISITGFAFSQLSLSIKSSTEVEITLFDYDTFITFSPPEIQNISVGIRNTGTEPYMARIEEFVYFFNNITLIEVAHYYDTEVYLNPGMRREFETIFTTNRMGFYYIKLRITYGSKRTEAWGSFYAGYIITNETPVTGPTGPITTGTEYLGGGVPPRVYYVSAPNLNLTLEYPEEIYLNPGQSVLTSIKAKNVGGNNTLHEVRLYVSATNLLDIDVNPKQVYYLDANTSMTFLLDIQTSRNIPYGTYPIDFEVVTRELKKTGTILLNIVAYNVSLEEDVRKKILNYEYLITELEIEILDAYRKGFDVSLSEGFLDNAKINLQGAKNYYELKEYENALEKLNEVKENLKSAFFQLGQDRFIILVSPAFGPIWILVIAVMIGILFLFMFERRKKKKLKKPKLLKASEIET